MTACLCLPAHVDGSEAARLFMRPRLSNLFGLLAQAARVASPGDPSSRIPPFVEQLWMPAYAVCLRTTMRGRHMSVWTAVDGWGGQFSLLECVDALVPCEPSGDHLPPSLSADDAAALARKGLLQQILRRRDRLKEAVIEGIEAVKPYYFPLWVLYFRRGARLDVRVLDACTGQSVGAKIRVAVVNALIAVSKQRKAIVVPQAAAAPEAAAPPQNG